MSSIPIDRKRGILEDAKKRILKNHTLEQIKPKKIQYWLTLLQKMVVIAIIGILAQDALSTYQD